MSNRFLLSCALLTLAAGPEHEAIAQPFFTPPAPACVAPKRATRADSLLADKIAAADRSIEAGKPGAWTALADLAQYACAITGDRLPADAAFRRCIRECTDERDVYFAHVIYAQMLDRFGDVLGAENQYLQALQSRDEPQDAYTAYIGYANMLERQGRTRDALDVLNRFAGDWSYRSPTMQLKLSLMRELGMDTQAEEEGAKQRPDTDLARTRADSPPLSAIPVERNPLAQAAFGRTIEVVGNAWIEPAAEAGAPRPGQLLYRRASMPDPRTFARSVALAPGQRFVVVVDLGTSGCRVAVGDARYDLEECPWRTGRADAGLFRVVEERTPLAPPVVVRPRPPLPVGPSPQSEPAPLWAVWEEMYSVFAAFERRGEPAYSASVLEQNAGLTPAEAAQVRAAGAGYVQQLERIDADTRRQIAERFGPSQPDGQRGPPPGSRDPSPPLVIDSSALPAGKTLQEVLEEEGIIARLDSQKDALLRAHIADLGRAIPADKVASLERVVQQRAPGVRRVTRTGPPVARPLRGQPPQGQ
jgi:tetratricopeptide (TPR) repeat protein